MSLSKDDAAQALKEIDEAAVRAQSLQGYRSGAPYAILWGVIWLVANTVTQFDFRLGHWAWSIGIGLAIVVSMILSALDGRKRSTVELSGAAKARAKRNGWKYGTASALSWLFLIALYSILWPFSYRQFNASISLIWMFVYMGLGVVIGWRLFAIGAVAAVAILFGYFQIHQYYDLWMGVVAGGALMLGGFWLRKV